MSEGFVYFITSEPDQYVKVGWALHNPWARMAQLQTGCPEALRMMACAPASREEERLLHRTFAELQYRGEWFILDHKLADFVQYLSDDWPRETKAMATREAFEGGLWDVVITGFEHPDMPDDILRNYRRSGNGLLWQHIHPEAVEVCT